MDNKPRVRVLVVEDNPGDARLLQETLAEVESVTFTAERVDRLSSALKRLSSGGVDVVLLDLGLPDSHGLDTFTAMHAGAAGIPIVVLSGLNDESIALQAVKQGAQDYLVKGQLDHRRLVRAMRYAIERQQTQEQLRALSTCDELTGLSNRRGFTDLTHQYLGGLTHQDHRPLLLFVIDVNGLKRINDRWGHKEGDRALVETAAVLKETFGESAILARVGGDEFMVLATDFPAEEAERLAAQLQDRLKGRNGQGRYPYALSLSVGFAHYDPQHPRPMTDLIAQADALMYQQKRAAGD